MKDLIQNVSTGDYQFRSFWLPIVGVVRTVARLGNQYNSVFRLKYGIFKALRCKVIVSIR